jgi:hypothetical protein
MRGVVSKRSGRRALLALVSALFVFVPRIHASSGRDGAAREAELKAAYIVNIARFVEWPAEMFGSPDAPVVIRIVEAREFPPQTLEALSRQQVKGRRIEVRDFEASGDGPCHIVYCNSAKPGVLRSVLDAFADKPVVTIGDEPGFTDLGGMVMFFRQGAKLRLEVNLVAKRRAGVGVSSQLLQVSRVVEVGS